MYNLYRDSTNYMNNHHVKVCTGLQEGVSRMGWRKNGVMKKWKNGVVAE